MKRHLVLGVGSLSVVLLSLGACGEDDGQGSAAAAGGAGATSGSAGAGSGGMSVGGGGSGGSGSGGSEGGASPGSEGCGKPLDHATEEWAQRSIDVGGTMRELFVWLPADYDELRAYPVVYQFHGCSTQPAKENNNPPVHNQSGPDAIVVRGRAVGNCWDTAPGGEDVAFFDALVAAIESAYCADPERRFATGYSSGAFMTHRLACERGDVLRGVASIAGGLGGSGCTGQVAALLIHDENDETVAIGLSEQARDRHLANNGCDVQAPTTDWGPSPCEEYAGCDAGFPVVWCQTTGQNHSRQDGLSAPAFWQFLSAL